MATPEAIAIRSAQAHERLADEMQLIRESQDRIEVKLDALLSAQPDVSKAPAKAK